MATKKKIGPLSPGDLIGDDVGVVTSYVTFDNDGGLIFAHASDIDQTLWSLPDITGDPLVIWDESEDAFAFSHGLFIIADMRITTGTITSASGTITFNDENLNTSGDTTLGGDLIFNGAGKGMAYGSLYLHEGAVNIDISGAGQGVYVKVTGLTSGLLNGVTNNSDAFRVTNPGVYKVDWQISGDSAGTGKDYEFDLFVNGVEQSDGSAKRGFGAVGSLGSASGTAILDITSAVHDIDIRIKEPGGAAGTDIDLFHVNFNIVQIGGT